MIASMSLQQYLDISDMLSDGRLHLFQQMMNAARWGKAFNHATM
jgi:hypothetical protein